MEGLHGIPVAQIAAGGDFVHAVSNTGAVFSWGRNQHGQLGLSRAKQAHEHVVYGPERVTQLKVR